MVLLFDKDTKFESNSQRKSASACVDERCFYLTKIQNLKAILNNVGCSRLRHMVLLFDKDTKFESNSQRIIVITYLRSRVLLFDKDTKFESNSQHSVCITLCISGCFYLTKIQNLKAILNYRLSVFYAVGGAFIWQRYKIWKQFSTQPCHPYCLD